MVSSQGLYIFEVLCGIHFNVSATLDYMSSCTLFQFQDPYNILLEFIEFNKCIVKRSTINYGSRRACIRTSWLAESEILFQLEWFYVFSTCYEFRASEYITNIVNYCFPVNSIKLVSNMRLHVYLLLWHRRKMYIIRLNCNKTTNLHGNTYERLSIQRNSVILDNLSLRIAQSVK